MRKMKMLACLVGVLGAAAIASADFIAFNDMNLLAAPYAPHVNATTISYIQSGQLKNIVSGAVLPVTATGTIVGDTNDQYGNGGDCNAGTDAGVFRNIVAVPGSSELEPVGQSPRASSYTMTFSNLNPAMQYIVTLTGNRADSGYTKRWSRVSIAGADSFTNSSSSGVTVISPSEVAFCTGHNTVTGYVAQWPDIAPGSDGIFSVTSTRHDAYTEKGYAMTVFRLEEVVPEPATVGLLCLGGLALLRRRRG